MAEATAVFKTAAFACFATSARIAAMGWLLLHGRATPSMYALSLSLLPEYPLVAMPLYLRLPEQRRVNFAQGGARAESKLASVKLVKYLVDAQPPVLPQNFNASNSQASTHETHLSQDGFPVVWNVFLRLAQHSFQVLSGEPKVALYNRDAGLKVQQLLVEVQVAVNLLAQFIKEALHKCSPLQAGTLSNGCLDENILLSVRRYLHSFFFRHIVALLYGYIMPPNVALSSPLEGLP
jgi:hypothetical protein